MRAPMLSIFCFLALVLTGCGSSGGDSAATPAAPVTLAPASTDSLGTVQAFSRVGIFAAEPNTTVTIFTGSRAGEVSFPCQALGFTVTGKDGDTFRSTDGIKLFSLEFKPAENRVAIRRTAGSDFVQWTIERLPSSSG